MIYFQDDLDLPVLDSTTISPLTHVLRDSLAQFYGSRIQAMRTLLKLENGTANGPLRRQIHDYSKICQTQLYSIEHVFELLDQDSDPKSCELTDAVCKKACGILSLTEKNGAKTKGIRTVLAELFAHEITTLDYLMKLALIVDRMDVARIIREVQRKTQGAFELSFELPGRRMVA